MQYYTNPELAAQMDLSLVEIPFEGLDGLVPFTRQQAFRCACRMADEFNLHAEVGFEFFVGIYRGLDDVDRWAVFSRYDGPVHPANDG